MQEVAPRFQKSICLGEKLKTMLREKNIEMELYTARNNVVEECRGCGKCFDEGLCPQDQEDSMEYIRKKNSRSRFNCFTVASLFE